MLKWIQSQGYQERAQVRSPTEGNGGVMSTVNELQNTIRTLSLLVRAQPGNPRYLSMSVPLVAQKNLHTSISVCLLSPGGN